MGKPDGISQTFHMAMNSESGGIGPGLKLFLLIDF